KAKAKWRTAIAQALRRVLSDDARPDLETIVRDASWILDIGRSVDYYDHHTHTVDIVLTADLHGFSQRDRAILAAAIDTEGNWRASSRAYKTMLDSDDLQTVEMAGLILALAEGIEPRTHADDDLHIRRQEGKRDIRIAIPLAAPWGPDELIARVQRVF